MQEDSGNSDFSFVVPTEYVDLPSQGRFYPPSHPLHAEECIEIRQMTAKEEDILTSRTLLKKGTALEKVIRNLIVNKAIDPDSLLVGDRNAIIVATRVSAYGSEYSTKVGCPSCGTTQDYAFDLNSASIYNGEHAEDYGIEAHPDGTFSTELPKTKLNIHFKLLVGRDERRYVAGVEHDKKNKNQHERNVTRYLSNIIVSVNGNSTSEAIKYVVENIPSQDSRHLRKAYQVASPNLDLTQHFGCSECDYEQEMEVPLTADFFWPDR
jgi:hypothetical protein